VTGDLERERERKREKGRERERERDRESVSLEMKHTPLNSKKTPISGEGGWFITWGGLFHSFLRYGHCYRTDGLARRYV
jgi:hypothetical protein